MSVCRQRKIQQLWSVSVVGSSNATQSKAAQRLILWTGCTAHMPLIGCTAVFNKGADGEGAFWSPCSIEQNKNFVQLRERKSVFLRKWAFWRGWRQKPPLSGSWDSMGPAVWKRCRFCYYIIDYRNCFTIGASAFTPAQWRAALRRCCTLRSARAPAARGSDPCAASGWCMFQRALTNLQFVLIRAIFLTFLKKQEKCLTRQDLKTAKW